MELRTASLAPRPGITPEPPAPQAWKVCWRDSVDGWIERTLNLTRVEVDAPEAPGFVGFVGQEIVLLIPRERFISAFRADILPGDE